MTVLAGTGIEVVLGSRTVLRGADVTAGPGQVLGLIGANGAGKSTLLQVLAGLLRPAAGMVTLDGEGLDAMPSGRLAVARAYLPQSPLAHWALTAGEIVALGRLPHRRNPAGDAAAVDRALARTDTAAFRDRRIDTLSGGERMRVLLARALAVEAPVLLADEPVSALDPRHQLRIMQLLHGLAEFGCTVVVVLHELSLAARFCHRLVLLHDGAVLAEGAPPDVLTDANLAQAYGVRVRRHEQMLIPWDVLEE